MITKNETVLDINAAKAKLMEWVMGEFNTMILIVRPFLDFMNVISILPPTDTTLQFMQPQGEFSPPIFTKEEALRLLDTKYAGWKDDLVLITLDGRVAETIFVGDNVFSGSSWEDVSVEQVCAGGRKSGPRPGYSHLPTTLNTPKTAKRLSVSEKEKRNADIAEFYKAGISVREIAEMVGLSAGYIYQLTSNYVD